MSLHRGGFTFTDGLRSPIDCRHPVHAVVPEPWSLRDRPAVSRRAVSAIGTTSLLEQRPGNANTHVGHTIAVSKPQASRRAKRLRIPAEGAPSKHMAAAISRCPGRPVSWRSVVGVVPAILNPIINIAMDLIEPPGVGLEHVDR